MQLVLNIPVKDLKRSKDFFAALGFSFNPDFTDGNAACLVLGNGAYAMLIAESFFKGFTKKEIADTAKTTEAIFSLAVESKDKVIELSHKAMQAGGKLHRSADDHGWMYSQSFEDPDGHIWEAFYMDEKARPKAKQP